MSGDPALRLGRMTDRCVQKMGQQMTVNLRRVGRHEYSHGRPGENREEGGAEVISEISNSGGSAFRVPTLPPSRRSWRRWATRVCLVIVGVASVGGVSPAILHAQPAADVGTSAASAALVPQREVSPEELEAEIRARKQHLREFRADWERKALAAPEAEAIPERPAASDVAPLPDAPDGEITRERAQAEAER